jgi:hypothetical protein
VILHGDYGCFRRAALQVTFDSYPIVKFERQTRSEYRVFRTAKLHDRRFPQLRTSRSQRSYLHGNPNSMGAGEETSQAFRTSLLVCGKRYFVGPFHVASQPA